MRRTGSRRIIRFEFAVCGFQFAVVSLRFSVFEFVRPCLQLPQDTRRKTCVLSRACVIDGRVTVFLPPEMKGKTPNAYNWLGFEEGMVHA